MMLLETLVPKMPRYGADWLEYTSVFPLDFHMRIWGKHNQHRPPYAAAAQLANPNCHARYGEVIKLMYHIMQGNEDM
jgi:hypothetical protein